MYSCLRCIAEFGALYIIAIPIIFVQVAVEAGSSEGFHKGVSAIFHKEVRAQSSKHHSFEQSVALRTAYEGLSKGLYSLCKAFDN